MHYHVPDRTIEVARDGTVRFISAAGTVTAQFRETEKRDLLRMKSYQSVKIVNDEVFLALVEP